MTLDAQGDAIAFYLSVQDEQATPDELQAILATLAGELVSQSAQVEPVAPTEATEQGLVAKGEKSSSILNVEINLDTLKTFSKWLYDRLAGTPTIVEFKYEGAEFKFNGRKDSDRASAQKDFEDFVLKLEAAKKSKNG